MSTAFQLDFTGPQTRCDFPGCIANAYHEGQHQFLSEQEKNERLAAAVTSYGVGTRSYNRSAEKREMDRQRAESTARYQEQREATIAQFALSQGIPVVNHKGEASIRVSDATFEYLSRHHGPILVPLRCTCAQRPYPHELSVHQKVRHERVGQYLDYYDLPCRFAPEEMRWPWSLRFAPDMEGK